MPEKSAVVANSQNGLYNESIESWNDVRHAFDNIRKRRLNGFSWHRGILPRYKDGSLNLWFGFVERGVGWHWWELSRDFSRMNQFDRFNMPDSGQGQPVFVGVYEDMELPERKIPSVVRLYVPEFFNNGSRDFIFGKPQDALGEIVGDGINGEIRPILPPRRSEQGTANIGSTEFPSDVIQGTSEIPKTVADDATELYGRACCHGRTDLPLISVILERNDKVRVRIQVPPNFDFECAQVLLCPDDFEASTIQRMRHSDSFSDKIGA